MCTVHTVLAARALRMPVPVVLVVSTTVQMDPIATTAVRYEKYLECYRMLVTPHDVLVFSVCLCL